MKSFFNWLMETRVLFIIFLVALLSFIAATLVLFTMFGCDRCTSVQTPRQVTEQVEGQEVKIEYICPCVADFRQMENNLKAYMEELQDFQNQIILGVYDSQKTITQPKTQATPKRVSASKSHKISKSGNGAPANTNAKKHGEYLYNTIFTKPKEPIAGTKKEGVPLSDMIRDIIGDTLDQDIKRAKELIGDQ